MGPIDIDNSTTETFAIGERIVKNYGVKIGEITEILTSGPFRYRVQFVDGSEEEVAESEISRLESIEKAIEYTRQVDQRATEEIAAPPSRFTEEQIEAEARRIAHDIDKTLEGEARHRLAISLIEKQQSIEAALYTLQTTDTDPRTIAESLDFRSIPVEGDESIPEFPRLSGSIADLADALCPDIPREFKVMSLVTYWGLIRSGLDTLETEPHLQPRFYTVAIAPPGVGKSASANEARISMSSVSTRYALCPSVDSGPALVDEFVTQSEKMNASLTDDNAARVLIDCDELSDLFEKGKSSRQSRNSLFGEMLKLFEGNRTGNHARSSGKGKIEISNAHLTILAGATTENYANLWSATGGGATGLQSRFTLVTTAASKMPAQQRRPDGQRVQSAIARLQQQAHRPGTKIKITPDAAEMFRQWWDSAPRDKPSESRIPDIVKRLLIVLAGTNGVDMIDQGLMAQGIAFGDYQVAVREHLNPADASSWTQAFENEIIRRFERRGTMTLNDARRLIQPQRRPGGVGPFLAACKNLANGGILKNAGKTEKGTIKYQL